MHVVFDNYRKQKSSYGSKRMKTNSFLKMMGVFALTLCLSSLEMAGQKQFTSSEATRAFMKVTSPEKSKLLPIYPPGYTDWLWNLAMQSEIATSDDDSSVTVESFSIAPPPGNTNGYIPSATATSGPAPEYFYEVVDLGALASSGSVGSRGLGINNQGVVIGSSWVNPYYEHAFSYSNGQLTDLGTLATGSYPLGINDGGVVVGWAWTAGSIDYKAFAYINGQMQAGMFNSRYHDINNSGDIVGWMKNSLTGNNLHAVLISNGKTNDLGSLGTSFKHSEAWAINNEGEVVGFSYISSATRRAFLYSGGYMQEIGSLGGNHSKATGINDFRRIVGYSDTADAGITHAFLHSNGEMIDIGTLPGYSLSFAQGINNSSQIVGYVSNPPGNPARAFIYSNGEMRDLNELIDTRLGWVLKSATAINESGQITGSAINPSGFTRAYLLTPLVGGRIIDSQQPQPAYGQLPIKVAGKTKLIVVTHGSVPKGSSVEESTAWVTTMTNAIQQYLTDNNQSDWQVFGYMWTDGAIASNPEIFAGSTLHNASAAGKILGDHLINQSWSHVHLIAHSAGGALIQTASEIIEPLATTLHCTFFDPYVGPRWEWKNRYGKGADWSDHYFTIGDPDTGGGIGNYTESLLLKAYNIDVTQLHKIRDIASYSSSPTGTAEPCYRTVSTHGWPIDFYLNSIASPQPTGYNGFGFPLSKEGGNWDFATSTYLVGDSTKLGTPDQECTSLAIGTGGPATRIDTFGSYSIQSSTGIKSFSANGLGLETQSPSWVLFKVDSSNLINYASFGAEFKSSVGAEGLLTVYWDDNVIGSIDERAVQPGTNVYTFDFPQTLSNTVHTLGFRLDRFTATQSKISITNIVVGSSGPSEPFTLKFTTNTFGGLKVHELVGPAGYNYTVQTSSNLLGWSTVAFLLNTNGSVRFVDQTATNQFQQRFYRALVQ
jgi:probable HAF family extracellular repeat protein